MIHLDEGHKQWSYFWLMWCLTVPCWYDTWQFYVAYETANEEGISSAGVGYIGLNQIFGWPYLLHHAQWKGASLWGRYPHITGVWVGCKKIEMKCMHQFDGRQFFVQSSLQFHFEGWGYPQCGSPTSLGSSFWSSIQVLSLECWSSKHYACG